MNRSTSIVIAAAVLTLSHAGAASGATPQEASKLGTTLTAVGAERDGNADGSIPAYTGGLTEAPAGFVKESGVRPDPFASERPLFSIDAKNVDQYVDKLTEGTKALLRKYPAYRVDVYPTHRTAAFPASVAENTLRNATRARIANGGLTLQDAKGGYPFPIPQSGAEAMWNHLAFFGGHSWRAKVESWNVTGTPMLAARMDWYQDSPYHDAGGSDSGSIYRLRNLYTGPARRAGEGTVVHEPVDFAHDARRAWQYLPGQRRVRLAPDISFDTPNPATAGATVYDDTYLFNGSMERYDFRIVGKRELYVPYNAYRVTYLQGDAAKLLTPRFLNPDMVRWELHRVWVIEATLKSGKRHIYGKRVFYLDEDTWRALASDAYDLRGNMYRVGFAYLTQSYDVPAPLTTTTSHYDLLSGMYAVNTWPHDGNVVYAPPPSDRWFTADAMAAGGIR
jgi:hypothetical protein